MNTMTIQQTLQLAKAKLTSVAENPLLEAEILLAHVLKKPRTYLYSRPEEILTSEMVDLFLQLVQRRCNKEPIAYLTGLREFWSLQLDVTPDTLIPRPETELLVEIILNLFASNSVMQIADLGTGSGAIALSLAMERPQWQIYATDISDSALQIARKNAHKFAIKNVSFYLGNWCTALPHSDFDVIVSNPPYIATNEWQMYAEGLKYEPIKALISGVDGLDAIRIISQSAKNYLKPGGYLLVEHGFLQGEDVRRIFNTEKYKEIRTIRDLTQQERVTLGRFFP